MDDQIRNAMVHLSIPPGVEMGLELGVCPKTETPLNHDLIYVYSVKN